MAKKFLIVVFLSICTASALYASAKELIPVGHTTGIKLFSDGVMIAQIVSVGEACPARDAGLTEGDVILRYDGVKVTTNEMLKEKIERSAGRPAALTVKRDGKTLTFTATPRKDENGNYQLGLWVRDSMAGIGTITFLDPKTREFGALGHGICDSETGLLVPLATGSLMESTVRDVHRGNSGTPGELVGDYDLTRDSGYLYCNTNEGIFGVLEENVKLPARPALPSASRDEVELGPATILTNVEGDAVREYAVEITKIFPPEDGNPKNLMIRVTDPALLEKTGGIVQGMSGSPILQNGKLVGAVTHVLVGDSQSGYAILIENMLQTLERQEMRVAA